MATQEKKTSFSMDAAKKEKTRRPQHDPNSSLFLWKSYMTHINTKIAALTSKRIKKALLGSQFGKI
jgi:hypothetical protein